MKTLLILPAMPADAPFLKYYVDWFLENGCEFDVTCLNRKSYVSNDYPSNYYVYNMKIDYGENIIKRFIKNYRFCRYVKKLLVENEYDRVILFTLPILVFLSSFLIRNFKGKYIIDIRDYSSVYKMSICKFFINRALECSYANCISSVGFRSWLPKEDTYILSHNVGKKLLDLAECCRPSLTHPVNILTIGLIRDADANIEVIKNFANNHLYKLSFVGDGPAINSIYDYAKVNKVQNVFFYGRYNKDEEHDIVENYDIINNYMPDNTLSNSLMSNRFYLSVLYGKPMIVREGSTQAHYVKKFNLGIIVDGKDDMEKIVREYCRTFDSASFDKGRFEFLSKVRMDIGVFESVLSDFVS